MLPIINHSKFRKNGFITLLAVTIILIIINQFFLTSFWSSESSQKIQSPSIVHKDIHFNWATLDSVEYLEFIHSKNYTNQKELFKQYNFNSKISDQLPVDRIVPDTRDSICQKKNYKIQTILTTSIIISYFNEAASVLLRTLTSIIRHTPDHLISEIILIDDCSTNVLNSNYLKNYHYKIRFYRNEKRQGLIRSRSLAAQHYSTGHWLLFLDSHCEVNIGWLEPLIVRLLLHPGVAVSPIIDIIDPQTFKYRKGAVTMRAAFDWTLQFKWIPSEYLTKNLNKQQNITKSFTSPTTSAGTFAIAKEWFLQLGGFDDHLDIWGGESLEMSLKIWMCGGQVEIVPCSRIGHIFRKRHPYSFPKGHRFTILRNLKRIAETWLDDYKHLFYIEQPEARSIEIETLTKMLNIKKNLHCRSFKWYLENVFQELGINNKEYIAWGDLKNNGKCLKRLGKNMVRLNSCYSMYQIYNNNNNNNDDEQKWTLNEIGIIRIENGSLCLASDALAKNNKNEQLSLLEMLTSSSRSTTSFPVQLLKENSNVRIETCLENSDRQKWHRDHGKIVHTKSGKCLSTINNNNFDINLNNCLPGYSQIWQFSIEVQKLK